jgi:hypothetical protein
VALWGLDLELKDLANCNRSLLLKQTHKNWTNYFKLINYDLESMWNYEHKKITTSSPNS